MVDFLDIRTLSLMSGMGTMSIFMIMFYITIKRKTYPGFIKWTIGTFFNSLGMILVMLRDIIPDFFSVILANLFILLFFIYSTTGFERFSNHQQKRGVYIITLILFAILFIYFTYITPNIKIRIIVISGYLWLYCWRICFIVWKNLHSVLPKRQNFLFLSYLFIGFWYLLRVILTILLEDQINNFMNAGIIQGISFIIMLSTNIIVCMLLTLCNAQRLEIDLLNAKKEIKTLTGLLPICSHCKKIRNDNNQWEHLEKYISTHSKAIFSHGICPECVKELYKDIVQ